MAVVSSSQQVDCRVIALVVHGDHRVSACDALVCSGQQVKGRYHQGSLAVGPSLSSLGQMLELALGERNPVANELWVPVCFVPFQWNTTRSFSTHATTIGSSGSIFPRSPKGRR